MYVLGGSLGFKSLRNLHSCEMTVLKRPLNEETELNLRTILIIEECLYLNTRVRDGVDAQRWVSVPVDSPRWGWERCVHLLLEAGPTGL